MQYNAPNRMLYVFQNFSGGDTPGTPFWCRGPGFAPPPPNHGCAPDRKKLKQICIDTGIFVIFIHANQQVRYMLWTRGKPLAWDIPVADTYANSYVDDAVTRAAAADRAASKQDLQIHRAFQDPPLHSNCNGDGMLME